MQTEENHQTVRKLSGTIRKRRNKRVLSIEQALIWAYQVEKVNEGAAMGIVLWEQEILADSGCYRAASGDGCYQIMRNHITGGRVDGGGPFVVKVHPDAELLHELILSNQFSHAERFFLIAYGKTGLTPDWMPGLAPSVCPVLRASGRPVYIQANKKIIGCELDIVVSQADIDRARALYRAWHDSLCKLSQAIRVAGGRAVDHTIKGPQSEAFPWAVKKPLALAQIV